MTTQLREACYPFATPLVLKHQEIMEKGLSDHSVEMKDLGLKLEDAKAYPIWALIVFGLSILLNILGSGTFSNFKPKSNHSIT